MDSPNPLASSPLPDRRHIYLMVLKHSSWLNMKKADSTNLLQLRMVRLKG